MAGGAIGYKSLKTSDPSSPLYVKENDLSLQTISKYMGSSLQHVVTALPPPLPHHRNKQIYLLASVILCCVVIHNATLLSLAADNCNIALKDSSGFFTDIPLSEWKKKKDRVKNQPRHNDKELGLRSKYTNRNSPSKWYEHNWQTNFECTAKRRIGGTSEGSKVVCDPHRIPQSARRSGKRSKNESDDGCLIYSFGRGSPNSPVFDFSFETEILEELGGPDSCELHFFDHRLDNYGGDAPDGITVHHWGLEGKVDAPKARRDFMTMKEIVHHLGHEGRSLEIMRIDCDGCEWHTFSEWITSGVRPRQVVTSLHGAPRNEDELFEILEKNNYVIFHREADTRYGGMWQEYGFLKLSPSFFGDNNLD